MYVIIVFMRKYAYTWFKDHSLEVETNDIKARAGSCINKKISYQRRQDKFINQIVIVFNSILLLN